MDRGPLLKQYRKYYIKIKELESNKKLNLIVLLLFLFG